MMKAKLKELGDIITGNTPSKKAVEYWDSDDICFVKPDIIDETGVCIINDSTEYISHAARPKARIVGENALFVTCIGSIGKIGVAGPGEYAFNQQINAIIPNSNMNSKYLAYAILYNKPQLAAIANAPVVPIINKSQFSEFELNVEDDYSRQLEIVAVLDRVRSVIDSRKEELNKLDELIKARFVEIMGSSELSAETTVEAVTERVKVGFVGTCEKYYTDDSGIPMLRTGNITDRGIDLRDLKYVTEEFHKKNLKSQIHSGDLLIARHGSNGQANVYEGPEAQCLNAVVIVPDNEKVTPVFLAGLINSPDVKMQIERTLVGSTQHVVNTKSIASLRVRIPDISVQTKYVEFVKQVDKSKAAVQKSLDEAQLLFDSLMQDYFG